MIRRHSSINSHLTSDYKQLNIMDIQSDNSDTETNYSVTSYADSGVALSSDQFEMLNGHSTSLEDISYSRTSLFDDDELTIEDEVTDQEHQELASLRCQSVQTEVLADRHRRRNRNVNYPGLAFGSSIFSSNTMMKFSVIANELHNIMNVQLKRVGSPVFKREIIS